MSVTRRVTFRLYPNTAQKQQLFEWKRLHCYLYNACVEHRRTSYQKFGKSINYFDQQNALPAFKECWNEYKKLGSHALQATVKRVDFAFQRCFKLKSGYPKFKANRRYKGWTYPCKAGWKACTEGKNGYLKLTNLGNIKMRGQARDWGTPKTCTILFKQGKWYTSITVSCIPSRIQTDKGAIGLDFGVYHVVADSNGGVIDNPRFINQAQARVNQLSKKSRRKRPPNHRKRVKASRRWKKANSSITSVKVVGSDTVIVVLLLLNVLGKLTPIPHVSFKDFVISRNFFSSALNSYCLGIMALCSVSRVTERPLISGFGCLRISNLAPILRVRLAVGEENL